MTKVLVQRLVELPSQLTVMVTGANSGIGKAQVNAFLEKGHRVIGIDRIKGNNNDSKELYTFYKADVSNEGEVRQLFEWFAESGNQLHVLCNTAGVLDDYKTIEQTDSELWQQIMQANLMSSFLMSKYALPFLLAQSASRIINMASIASLTAGGGGIAYTSAKHAVAGFTKQLAYDYASTGLRVNAIAPGAIQTAMTAADFEQDAQNAVWVANATPLKRWAQPEEVAALSLFLASNEADYMTGTIIPLDGGWLIR